MRALFSISLLLLTSCSGIRSRYHEVSSGESLNQIAQKYEVPVAALKEKNQRTISRGLNAGTKLFIPFEKNPRWNQEPLIARNVADDSDGGDDASESLPTKGKARGKKLSYNLSEARFHWPVMGPISSPFGERHGKPHEGVDIAVPEGTAIRSARSGRVIYATNKISGYGNMVIVRHSDAFSTIYAHLSRMSVKRGDFVQRGTLLGKAGHTGHATSSHLHFEIRNRRVPVDPLQYLHGQLASNRFSR